MLTPFRAFIYGCVVLILFVIIGGYIIAYLNTPQ